jgi:hypothetical protein
MKLSGEVPPLASITTRSESRRRRRAAPAGLHGDHVGARFAGGEAGLNLPLFGPQAGLLYGRGYGGEGLTAAGDLPDCGTDCGTDPQND